MYTNLLKNSIFCVPTVRSCKFRTRHILFVELLLIILGWLILNIFLASAKKRLRMFSLLVISLASTFTATLVKNFWPKLNTQ
jgi:hypothetical protein